MVLKMLLNRSFFKLTKTNLGGAYPWRRLPGLAKDFISCPIFTKLAWMVHLGILLNIPDLHAESEQ